jgi:hypothetical protein
MEIINIELQLWQKQMLGKPTLVNKLAAKGKLKNMKDIHSFLIIIGI